MADNDVYTDDVANVQPQLTQARVPLDEAGDALMARDASGRIPIVVVPKRSGRANPWLVLSGIAAIVAGIIATDMADTALWVGIAVPVGLALVVVGLYQSFIVRVPEGANALLLRGGRYLKTLPSGTHFVPPFYPVSHLVTRRTIPFDVPAYNSPTADNVPATVDLLIMFTIVDPYKFVYSISADDFDQVFLAASQDALRQLVRKLDWHQVPDLTRESTAVLQEKIAADVADYGVVINKVNITYAAPPAEFMKSQEQRELSAVLEREQAERHALEMRRVEFKAQAEEMHLRKLEERLAAFPNAARWEFAGQQLSVASSLAGNTRAVVQVGNGSEIASAFVATDVLAQSRAEALAADENKATPA